MKVRFLKSVRLNGSHFAEPGDTAVVNGKAGPFLMLDFITGRGRDMMLHEDIFNKWLGRKAAEILQESEG